jgi:Fe2+ or Zn2+ uptake regulation protein
MRASNQRTIILNYLKSVKTHPPAREVYQAVKKLLPHISFATVYRNLDYLTKQGEILELTYPHNASRYDGNPKNHYHFTCQHCQTVIDLDCKAADLKQMQTLIKQKVKGVISGYRLDFFGVCEKCQKQEKGGVKDE